MGGFFSSPEPPAPTPVVLPVAPAPVDEARTKRIEEMERNRRGRAGLIATSDRGLLGTADASATPSKRLLGE